LAPSIGIIHIMSVVLKYPSFWLLLILCLVLPLFPGYSFYRYISYQPGEASYQDLPDYFADKEFALYPVRTGERDAPQLTAEGVFVIDVDSAVPIYEKEAQKILYPASTTKMMTALVAREAYQLDDVLEVPEATYAGSTMKLFPNEKISVNNLLYGLLINSGNDAAEVLAERYPSGREGFISKMNEKSSELGLRNSSFVNPSGLPESGHVSTAWDLGHLAAMVMKDEELRKIVRTAEATVYGVGGERHILKSTNKLLGTINGLDGVKTGYTDEAGEVLVSSVVRNNKRIVVVLLKSSDRFGETKQVIDWVYANHEWRDIKPKTF
jgi:serine-type D-Ala-D-Ala carboxypeptidase (penicillin-binding protein 5/6)